MKHQNIQITYRSNTSKQLNTGAFMLNFVKVSLQKLLDIFLEILSTPKKKKKKKASKNKATEKHQPKAQNF